ncbi:protein LURP-one-related 10-like [Rutidosis leptorrhynchoides]|uniref:protein LURP-one-related 10-like n=1 Tax=Rutidosis leptorrhynchoides TaxID=125765 RepID=UPI003A98E0A3
MAQPGYVPSCVSVFVIGSQFVAPYPFELIVSTNSSGNHLVTDVDHKVLFKVKPCNSDYHEQRVLLGYDDQPIALIREKNMCTRSTWNVFRGESKEDTDLIFSAKEPKIFQSKTDLRVFLANKTSSKEACDFKIAGSWTNRSCTIYMGNSSTAIAQMHKMTKNSKYIKDKFMVAINPNVDYAFVVALIAIVEAMKSSGDDEDVDNMVQAIGIVAQVVGAN